MRKAAAQSPFGGSVIAYILVKEIKAKVGRDLLSCGSENNTLELAHSFHELNSFYHPSQPLKWGLLSVSYR